MKISPTGGGGGMKEKIHLLCLLTMEVLTTIIKIIMNQSTAHVTFVELYVFFCV